MLRGFVTIYCLVLLLPCSCLAAAIQIPQTGQNTCYSADGVIIDCAHTGQDGDKHTGVPLPTPRPDVYSLNPITDII